MVNLSAVLGLLSGAIFFSGLAVGLIVGYMVGRK